jgi:hypothetical protein
MGWTNEKISKIVRGEEMNASKTIKLMKLASKIVMKEDLPLLKALHEADMKASKTNQSQGKKVSHLITDKREKGLEQQGERNPASNKKLVNASNPAPALKIKNKTANVFPFGDVIVPDIPSTNENTEVKGKLNREDIYVMGWNDGFDKGRASRNKEFKKFLDGFVNPTEEELEIINSIKAFAEKFEKQLGGGQNS